MHYKTDMCERKTCVQSMIEEDLYKHKCIFKHLVYVCT